MCTEMPSTAHAQWWLSTPLAREYVCQWCGKALPPPGIEPLPPAPKARALKGRAIWTLVLSHRYRREVHIQYTLPQLLFPLRARTHIFTKGRIIGLQSTAEKYTLIFWLRLKHICPPPSAQTFHVSLIYYAFIERP